MDTCMRLLLPTEFDLCDLEESLTPANDSTPSATSAHHEKAGPSSDMDEQPCCSKDLDDEKVAEEPEAKKRKKKAAEEEEEGEGEDADEESSEEESDMEEVPDEDLFIRNTGLISHKYSLDLNLSTGVYSLTHTSDDQDL